MVDRTVRCDKRGVYVTYEGMIFRPSDKKDKYDNGDGGLKAGDRVRVYYRASGDVTVSTQDGKKLMWCCEEV